MQIVPAVKAQTRFGELIDQAQREVIAVTRYGRTIAYVVSEHDMRDLQAGMQRRRKASAAFASYGKKVLSERASDVVNPSEDEMNAIVDELRR
jgi:antitoxin Phd